MRINAPLLGLAAAISAAVSYALCAFSVAVAPAMTARTFRYVMHMDLTSIARPLSWSSFAVGLVAFSSVVGLLVWLAATVFGALSGNEVNAERVKTGAGRIAAPFGA